MKRFIGLIFIIMMLIAPALASSQVTYYGGFLPCTSDYGGFLPCTSDNGTLCTTSRYISLGGGALYTDAMTANTTRIGTTSTSLRIAVNDITKHIGFSIGANNSLSTVTASLDGSGNGQLQIRGPNAMAGTDATEYTSMEMAPTGFYLTGYKGNMYIRPSGSVNVSRGTKATEINFYSTISGADEEYLSHFIASSNFNILTKTAGAGISRSLIIGTAGNSHLIFKTNNTSRWQVTDAGVFMPNANATYDFGTTSYRAKDGYFSGTVYNGLNTVAGTTGGLTRKTAEATANITANATITITLSIPVGSKILGCQLRVDSALATGETWNAAYSGGNTQTIGHEIAVAANTKINVPFDGLVTGTTLTAQAAWAAPITTATTNIAIQKHSNPGVDAFTAQGTIRAIVYYETFETMASL